MSIADTGWQPIETAPKDGTSILCAWTKDHYGIQMSQYWHRWRNDQDLDDALNLSMELNEVYITKYPWSTKPRMSKEQRSQQAELK